MAKFFLAWLGGMLIGLVVGGLLAQAWPVESWGVFDTIEIAFAGTVGILATVAGWWVREF